MKSIAFFFPYKEVSGCPVLFLNIAQKLSSTYFGQYKIYVVDYTDGYMASNISEKDDISLIPFQDGVKCIIDADYVIMQAYLPDAIRPEFFPCENTKVLMWVLHALNFQPIVFPFNFFRGFIENHSDYYNKILDKFYSKKIRIYQSFFYKLLNSGCITFMDKPCLDSTVKVLNLKDSPLYSKTPIASSDPTPTIYHKAHDEEFLHLGWVGRLCNFKIHILNYSLKMAHVYADKNHKKIVFHVVGNGEFEDILYNEQSDFFNIDRCGTVDKDCLDLYMLENFDINFAMGTSAIESAKLGIPTIKLDFSYSPIVGDYLFSWFHKSDNYDVGHNITDADLLQDNTSFSDIINEYFVHKDELSAMAYEFYKQNFSLEVVCHKLLHQLNIISLSWGNIPKHLLSRDIFRIIYYKIKYKI